jgi:3-oxoacyl-[acyl-carrier protein] reductase
MKRTFHRYSNSALYNEGEANTMSAQTIPSTSRLDGKVALVTGAGRGIGRGIAVEFAKRGAKVIINYRSSEASALEVVKEIKAAGSDAIAIKADVSVIPEIIKLFEEGKKAFGRIDIVMSNSGTEDFTPLLEVTPERYDEVFNTNTRSQFFVAQQAFKHCEEYGSVILMSSIAAGTRRPPNHSLYAGSKNAIKAFVRCLSTDMGSKKIRVNAIAPGGVKSDMFAHAAWRYAPGGHKDMGAKAMEDGLAAITPLGRVAEPVDVARVVCFLASEDSFWVNGMFPSLNSGFRRLTCLQARLSVSLAVPQPRCVLGDGSGVFSASATIDLLTEKYML